MPATRVQSMTREPFVAAFGGVFEHSPWVAEGAWDRGLDANVESAEGLHAALCAVVRDAPRDRRLMLLRAHPDLAGKLALAGDMTDDSKKEQAGAGLDRLTPDELARFTALNAAYVEKFGFPFIIAVRGLDRHQILAAFEERVRNAPAQEEAAALEQVERIALLRLREYFA